MFILFFSALPFVFFNVLFFVSYYLQAEGFNEAFYYHLNRTGIIDHEGSVLGLCAGLFAYFAVICFFTFKLEYFGGRWRLHLFSMCFVVVLAFFSPQVTSFVQMYFEAHSDHPLARYLGSIGAIGNPEIYKLISEAGDDFSYTVREKKNLVFIYAESLERNFFNKEIFSGRLCYLDDLNSKSIEFSEISQTSYTGWTIAGMVASLCGYPLQMPLDSSSNNFNLLDEFMTDTECVSDILKKEDYYLSFTGGADLNFAGKRSFLSSHGFTGINGKKDFLNAYPEGNENYNRWGLRDRPLLASGYEEFLRLSAGDRPFGMFFLTLDTHAPGFPDPLCRERYEFIGSNSMLDAVHCSTLLIQEFIEKIRSSEYSEQTVVVVMSDHLAHGNPAQSYLLDDDRKLMFMINMPSGLHMSAREKGTHYDVGPTVLTSIGIDSQRNLGFGRSMLTLLPGNNRFVARMGLLPERLGDAPEVKSFARNYAVKSHVRKTWGNVLGQIGEEGIHVDGKKYLIRIGDREFSFRNPWSENVAKPGSLLFCLGRDGLQLLDIFSLNDYVKLPDRFSIGHWLRDRKGLYLYVGSKFGIPFLPAVDNKGNNVLAFVDMDDGKADVIPVNGYLDLSPAEISKRIAGKNTDNFKFELKSDSLMLGDEVAGISILSCLDDFCQSHVEDLRHNSLRADWGMSVWQLDHNGDISLVEHIDHCGDRSGFNSAPSLDELVQSARSEEQAALVLIGHNSVFCDPKKDMLRWLQPYKLKTLKHIRFKQPYIGIIHLETGKIEEFTGKNSVQIEL